MNYYSIKIANREYLLRDTAIGAEISTEAGWLKPEQFINYLISTERMTALQDLAEIGLDRLVSGA